MRKDGYGKNTVVESESSLKNLLCLKMRTLEGRNHTSRDTAHKSEAVPPRNSKP